MGPFGGARRGELLAGCLATVQPQVLEDAADDLGVFDAGDDLDRAATVFAALDLDAEDAFEALPPHCPALRPIHRGRACRARSAPASGDSLQIPRGNASDSL